MTSFCGRSEEAQPAIGVKALLARLLEVHGVGCSKNAMARWYKSSRFPIIGYESLCGHGDYLKVKMEGAGRGRGQHYRLLIEKLEVGPILYYTIL